MGSQPVACQPVSMSVQSSGPAALLVRSICQHREVCRFRGAHLRPADAIKFAAPGGALFGRHGAPARLASFRLYFAERLAADTPFHAGSTDRMPVLINAPVVALDRVSMRAPGAVSLGSCRSRCPGISDANLLQVVQLDGGLASLTLARSVSHRGSPLKDRVT